MLASDKHSYLLRAFISYGRKFFYRTGRRCQCFKVFLIHHRWRVHSNKLGCLFLAELSSLAYISRIHIGSLPYNVLHSGRVRPYSQILGLGRFSLPGTNALAYLASWSVMKKKLYDRAAATNKIKCRSFLGNFKLGRFVIEQKMHCLNKWACLEFKLVPTNLNILSSRVEATFSGFQW